MDPGILCFQHCGKKFFCTIIPEVCPLCKGLLDTYNFNLIPFRIPYPFIKASQFPRAIVIRPTHGDFLHDYYNTKDLHIGVTTSQGAVVEFGMHGIEGLESLANGIRSKKNSSPWDQSLLVEQLDEYWSSYWDEVLYKVAKNPQWSSANYTEESLNCFSFVLEFLRELKSGDISLTAADPKKFCQQYIVNRTSAAGKYISLYRQLKKKPYIMSEST